MRSFPNRNRRPPHAAAVAGAVLAWIALGSGAAMAQSATRIPAPRGRAALEGYCPVCIVEMKRWVRGNPANQVTYDGKTYYFPSGRQKEMFLADPAKYVPALGGDCTVCYAKMGQRVPGSVRYASLHRNRLFLFASAQQKKEFVAQPEKYADVDLALGGNCAVCRVEIHKDVPGKPEIAAVYQGFRYLFPSERERQRFLANPARYAVKPAANRQTSLKTSDRQLVTVTGKSSCAGCDHGVAPIRSPDQLGLAISAADGKVYVVEEAHKLYPTIYEHRFEGLPLEVSGKVLKRNGKVTWIEPSRLKVLN